MVGDILDGHVPAEFEGIACQAAGVMFLGVGKVDFYLANVATAKAENAWHLEFQDGRLVADGQRAKGTFLAALGPDLKGTALGAAEPFAWLFDAKSRHASLERLSDKAVADDAKAVIQ